MIVGYYTLLKGNFKMKIIASDFDGTICRNGIITDQDKNAIYEWQKNGNLFGIVTGRGQNIINTLADFEIKLDYAIAYNGAIVLNSKGEILYEDWFKRGIAKEYFDFAYSTEYEFQYPYDCTYDPNDESKEHQLTLLLKDKYNANEFAEKLNKKFKGKLTSFSNGQWINTVKYGTSKATGIEHYAKLMGVKKEDIYTVGDFFNDLPMLQAFNGYVVDTCHPEMKKLIPNVCKNIAHLTEIVF